MKHFKKFWPIILILILASFLRLYRIQATMTFLEDEGRDMLIVKRMLDTKRPVLIGPQTSTGNMYLGPLYYYLITPALVLSNMQPIGPAIFIALSGILTVYLLYTLLRSWFGEKSALISTFLYATLPAIVSFSRNSWNPNLVPFATVLSLLFLNQLIFKKSTSKYSHWLGLGAVFGLLIQLHYMVIVFIAWELLLVIVAYLKDLKKLFFGLSLSLIGFLIVMSPFIIFEFRNNFVNTQALTRFVLSKEEHTIRYQLPIWLWEQKVIKSSGTSIGSVLSKSFFVDDSAKMPLTYIFSGLVLLATIVSWKKRNQYKKIFPYILLFGPIFTLGIYQENIHPHYLAFLFPIIILSLGSLLTVKKIRPLACLFIIFIIFWTLPTTINYIKSGPTNQVEKSRQIALYISQEANGEPYNVISNSTTFTTPYQYFLSLAPNSPSNSLEKTTFLICQDIPCSDSDVSTTLLFLAGPSHPTLDNYLGHPAINEFTNKRTLINVEHVFGGVWVAKLAIDN